MAIIKEYPKDGHKVMADKTEAWLCIEKDSTTGQEITRYMVHENPFENKLLKELKKASPQEIAELKQMLK